MFAHTTVLLHETVNAVALNPDGIYVDMTLGGAGHSVELLKHLSSKGRLIGIDRDEDALAAAAERLQSPICQVHLVHGNYKDIRTILADLEIKEVDGIICDLGVSSYQLDTPERGFSYQHDGVLDMRMDREQNLSAYEVVNTYSMEELAKIIRLYGEERWAKRIAEFIVKAREKEPLVRTKQLVQVIKQAIPLRARKTGPHPAKRTFQAIRIEVNGELRDLESAVRDAITVLKPGGRMGIITFHSLEDRIVKEVFKELSKGCLCPPEFPICVCGHKASIKTIGKAIRPSKEELVRNPRSRSATLRVAEKI